MGTKLTERECFLLCKSPSLTDDCHVCSEAGSRRLEWGRPRHPLSPGSPSPQLQDPGCPDQRSVAHVHLGLCPAGCSPPSGHVVSHITAMHPHRRQAGQNGSLLLWSPDIEVDLWPFWWTHLPALWMLDGHSHQPSSLEIQNTVNLLMDTLLCQEPLSSWNLPILNMCQY